MEIERKDIQDAKRRDIFQYTSSSLGHVTNIDQIVEFVLTDLTEITPPKKKLDINYVELKTDSGIGGATTTKPGNILLNWRKLFTQSAENYLSIIGVIATPYLIPLAALIAWNRITELSKIDLSVRHAMVLSALWDIKDNNNLVSGENTFDDINYHFKKHVTNLLTKNEYSEILSDLDKLQVLRIEGNGSISLLETVVKEYHA